jgi:PAS domain S-box-containing protein
MTDTQERPFMDAILGIIPSGVIIIDPSDVITTCNVAASHILGIDPSSIVGKHYQDVFSLLPQKLEHDLPGLLEAARYEGDVVIPYIIDCSLPAGGRVHLALSIFSVHDTQGDYLGTLILIEDRTELARMAEEIKRSKRG